MEPTPTTPYQIISRIFRNKGNLRLYSIASIAWITVALAFNVYYWKSSEQLLYEAIYTTSSDCALFSSIPEATYQGCVNQDAYNYNDLQAKIAHAQNNPFVQALSAEDAKKEQEKYEAEQTKKVKLCKEESERSAHKYDECRGRVIDTVKKELAAQQVVNIVISSVGPPIIIPILIVFIVYLLSLARWILAGYKEH